MPKQKRVHPVAEHLFKTRYRVWSAEFLQMGKKLKGKTGNNYHTKKDSTFRMDIFVSFFCVDTLCIHKNFTHETAAPQVVLQ